MDVSSLVVHSTKNKVQNILSVPAFFLHHHDDYWFCESIYYGFFSHSKLINCTLGCFRPLSGLKIRNLKDTVCKSFGWLCLSGWRPRKENVCLNLIWSVLVSACCRRDIHGRIAHPSKLARTACVVGRFNWEDYTTASYCNAWQQQEKLTTPCCQWDTWCFKRRDHYRDNEVKV